MLYSKEVNILPETQVRGSLQQIYPEPKVKGICCKLPLTSVSGSMICYMHHLYYGIDYSAWAGYLSGSVCGIVFLNFESTWLVLCVVAAFDWKRMSFTFPISCMYRVKVYLNERPPWSKLHVS